MFYMSKGVIKIYFLLGTSVLFASLNSVLLHKAPIKNSYAIYPFNFISSVVWVILLLLLSGSTPQFSMGAILWGLLYGSVQVFFLFFKSRAMSTGDVSVTTLLGNCSLLVSLIVSYIAWDERINIMQLLGLILLIISVFLCVYQPGKKSFSLKWIIYVFFFFIFASGVGIIFKAFSKYGGNTDLSAMMICSALVMMVAFLIISISYRPENFLKDDTGIKRFLLYAIISGVLSCGYNRLNAFLSGALQAVIFFPGFNGGVVLVSTIMGILLCREKYNAKKIIALLLGTVSIVIIGIF